MASTNLRDRQVAQLAAIYTPTSSEHQAEKASPAEQEADCCRLAKEHGMTVADVYRDIERYRVGRRLVDPSGTRADRPALMAMLKDAAAGKFGTILARREDRLYRGMRAMLLALETIQENKLQVLLARETFDPKLAPPKAWMAQMELEGMCERMMTGVKARLRSGRANTGQDCYGYRRVGEVIEVVEEEARWVKQVCEWYIQGTNKMEIRRRLIAASALQKGPSRPRKVQWHISSINAILNAVEEYASGVKIQTRCGEAFEIPVPPSMEYQLSMLTSQEVSLRQKLAELSEVVNVAALGDWEAQARHYVGSLRSSIEWLNAVPQTEEERREQFETQRQIVKMLVQKLLIDKDKSLRVSFA